MLLTPLLRAIGERKANHIGKRPKRLKETPRTQAECIEGFVKETLPTIRTLDRWNWSQQEGTYSTHWRCCIGAHLAAHFGVAGGGDLKGGTDWVKGREAAAAFIGCSVEALELLLIAAGAPDDPFGIKEWGRRPVVVWGNLAQIRTLPPHNPVATIYWLCYHHKTFRAEGMA